MRKQETSMGTRRTVKGTSRIRPWILVMIATTSSLLVTADHAGGTSQTAPSAAEPMDIAGRWTGSVWGSLADLRGGGCPGDALRQSGESISQAIEGSLQQNGANVTGDFVNTDADFSCRVTGTVTGNTFDGALSSCTDPPVDLGWIPGCGASDWQSATTARTFSATVTDSSMNGVVTQTYALRSGSQENTATLDLRFTVDRDSEAVPALPAAGLLVLAAVLGLLGRRRRLGAG